MTNSVRSQHTMLAVLERTRMDSMKTKVTSTTSHRLTIPAWLPAVTRNRCGILCVLVLLAAGCPSTTERTRPSPNNGVVSRAEIGKDHDGRIVLTIRELERPVFEQVLSDSSIVEAQLEEQDLDFNGDGMRDFVVYVWEGQNPGDRAFVIGRQQGTWSVWLEFRRPDCESLFPRDGARNQIRVADPDTKKQDTYCFHDGRFVKL
jgi:hypothetical protein